MVCFVPYFLPQPPSTSQSWVFGYNNRAGILILLATIAFGALWTRGFGLELPETKPAPSLPTKLLYISLAVVLYKSIELYLTVGIYGGYSESSYEILRIWLLDHGKQPYTDFEYAYGAGFLYGPLLLLKMFGLDATQAYFIFFALVCLAGTFVLFRIVSTCEYPTENRLGIYLLLYVTGTLGMGSTGVNYTFLRFISPLYFIAAYQKMQIGCNARWQVKPSLAAAAFTIVLLLISPETAIAFAFACMALTVIANSPLQDGLGRLITSSGILAIMQGIVFITAWRFHALDTVISANANANSLPITIAPYILFYFLTLFVCACCLFVRFSQRSYSDPLIGFVLVSIPLSAGALGRCDTGHVFWYGFGAIMSCLFYFSKFPATYKRYRTAFIVLLIIVPSVTTFPITGAGMLHSMNFRKPIGSWNTRADAISLDTLYPSWKGGFVVPFGYEPNGTGTTLSSRIDYGRYDGLINNDTNASITETISEMRLNPDKALLLPDRFRATCKVDPNFEKIVVSLLVGLPYLAPVAHPVSVRKPMCDYIVANYDQAQVPTAQNFKYGLWVRKPESVR